MSETNQNGTQMQGKPTTENHAAGAGALHDAFDVREVLAQ